MLLPALLKFQPVGMQHSSDPFSIMARESAYREAPVPAGIANPIKQTLTFEISATEFLLRLPFGLQFHYRVGKGVAFQRAAHVTDSEVTLFLEGSVIGAIAWINGLVPLHASAVVHDGRIHAFTGVSGAGKSTLVAALAKRGLPLFADDVLILDIHDGHVNCLPGHKKLKLWHDALALTGHTSHHRVRPDLEKFYIPLGDEPNRQPLPLAALWFLAEQARGAPEVSEIRGIQAFRMVRTAFYRPAFRHAVTGRAAMFAAQSAIAGQCRLARFDRPKTVEMFDTCADAMAQLVRGNG